MDEYYVTFTFNILQRCFITNYVNFDNCLAPSPYRSFVSANKKNCKVANPCWWKNFFCQSFDWQGDQTPATSQPNNAFTSSYPIKKSHTNMSIILYLSHSHACSHRRGMRMIKTLQSSARWAPLLRQCPG